VSAVTLAELGARLEKAGDIFVFTHEVADGDALGSMVALVLYLRGLGKQVYASFRAGCRPAIAPRHRRAAEYVVRG